MKDDTWANSPIHEKIREAGLDNCERAAESGSDAPTCCASFVSNAIPGGKLTEIRAEQEIHCCGSSDEIGEMRIRIMDGGGGDYIVMDATEWAFADEMEIRAFAESLCAMLAPFLHNVRCAPTGAIERDVEMNSKSLWPVGASRLVML